MGLRMHLRSTLLFTPKTTLHVMNPHVQQELVALDGFTAEDVPKRLDLGLNPQLHLLIVKRLNLLDIN